MARNIFLILSFIIALMIGVVIGDSYPIASAPESDWGSFLQGFWEFNCAESQFDCNETLLIFREEQGYEIHQTIVNRETGASSIQIETGIFRVMLEDPDMALVSLETGEEVSDFNPESAPVLLSRISNNQLGLKGLYSLLGPIPSVEPDWIIDRVEESQ